MRGLAMINVFVDIETLPDMTKGAKDKIEVKAPASYKKQESIDKWLADNADIARDEQWRKTALSGSYGSICVIGVSVTDKLGYRSRGAFCTKDITEEEMLIKFWSWLGDIVGSNQWRFVAHNAKFDVPYLWHRSVVSQTKPLYFNPHGRHGQHHYCTMEGWAGFNKYIKLDELASILGVKGKGDMDGSKVYDTWLIDPQKVVDYCLDDVRVLEEVYNKMEFVNV